jgi:hypothetical protein
MLPFLRLVPSLHLNALCSDIVSSYADHNAVSLIGTGISLAVACFLCASCLGLLGYHCCFMRLVLKALRGQQNA